MLSKLWITDYDCLRKPEGSFEDDTEWLQQPFEKEKPFFRMQENLKLLKALGAQTAEDENTCAAPINNISAFSFWWELPPDNFRTVEDLRRELFVKGCTIGALIWGSPHRHPSSGAYLPQPYGNLNNHSYKSRVRRHDIPEEICRGFPL